MTTHYQQEPSHQNWTSRPKHQSEFWPAEEDEPHWSLQLLLGLMLVISFLSLCFLL